jgi:hypothetical protein
MMTMKRALEEATRRWGERVFVHKHGKWAIPYSVGTIMLGCMMMVKGSGKTWEDAFIAADEAKKRGEELGKKSQEEVKVNMSETKKRNGESQEDYCRGCVLVCNVILGDDESCEDRTVEKDFVVIGRLHGFDYDICDR